jgi:alkane 1-monooxygenase
MRLRDNSPMTPLGYHAYRFSFWLAPTVGLSFLLGVSNAIEDASLQWMTWWAAIVSFVIVPIVDSVLGRVVTRFTPEEQARLVRDPMLRLIPWVCAGVWLYTLGWAIVNLPRIADFPLIHQIGFVYSLGIMGGILAINVAHELVHRNNKFERFLGGVLLSSVCYGVFKVEHVRGHHLRVATHDDPASARLNETIYAFLPRAIFGVYKHGWRIEAESLQRQGHRGFAAFIRNENLHWLALSAAIAVAAYWLAGSMGLLVFFFASLIAIIELELVDYIEHYGLQRTRDANGTLEPVRYQHSWDYSGWFTNAFLINLQRHSDHHAHGGRAFGALNSHPEAPQLPASYATMIWATFIPPLYRAIIHPRLPKRATTA